MYPIRWSFVNKNDTVTLNEAEVSDGGSETEVNTGINTSVNTESKEVDSSLWDDGSGKQQVCGEKIQGECLSNSDQLHRDGIHSNLKNANRKEEDVTKQIKVTDEVVMKDNKDGGNEFVIFDEAIVAEGCQKWDNTLCGMGKPLVMDNVTAEMCRNGLGRVTYARVLNKEGPELNNAPNSPPNKAASDENVPNDKNMSPNGNGSRGKTWSVDKEVLVGLRKSADTNQNIRGLSTSDKHNKVRKFINDESLNMCAVIETHLKAKKLQNIRDFIFKAWQWVDNMKLCDKGCKIIFEWNSDLVDMNVVHYGKQSVLCKMKAVEGDLSMFCTIVYVSNGGNERIELWKDLRLYSRMVGSFSWTILGDMNVTLDPKEHSAGSSAMTKDMINFKECVNDIEVDDVASSGLFFTWTKNLFKTKNDESAGILKKLDRIMGNEGLISKVVKDLKALKKPLKRLASKDGDLFKNAKALRDRLKEVQAKIDVNPSNKMLREEESNILASYRAAMKDEEQLLFQKAKIKWLSGNNSLVRKMSGTKDLFKCKLSIEEVDFMVREVSCAEIKKAIFQIDDNKAPRPDVITERMKECLGKLVSQNQSNFIPNRQIQDNILISQELLKGYDKKDGRNRVALKIDLQKAYETVNYDFLEDTLKGRRLGQGDPMSLYLFTLIMEVLNLLLIRRIDHSGDFQYHFGCRKLKITHICFADDLLMFSYGNKASVKLLKDTIKEFRQVLGLLPNYNKSTIIFGSVKESDREEILEIVPFKVEKIPVRYLGVLLITKRIGVKECKGLIDKVRKKSFELEEQVLVICCVLCKLEVKGPPRVKSKVACFGGVPTSDALTTGLEMSSVKCVWMSVIAAVRNVAKWDVSMSNSYLRVTLNNDFDALRDGSQ
nr:RNA-directed DNA polymerase, eukaryota, reverse transcriptase zinc-binding domain protein [Tanacetum cinerariifolium]